MRFTGFFLQKIQRKTNFAPKIRKTFLSRGVLPWVGRVTRNTNILLLRLIAIRLLVILFFTTDKWFEENCSFQR